MSFFEGIGKKLAQSGQEAAQKAKNTAEVIKLNSMISDEEKRINNFYLQIGKLYYETYGENPEELFAQFIADINECKAKIVVHTEQIRVVKGIAECGECGGQVPAGVPFCSSCGAAMKYAAADSDSGNACNNCGASLEPDVAFCTGCGTKVEQGPAPEASDVESE